MTTGHKYHAFTVRALAGYQKCAYCSEARALPPAPAVQGRPTSEAAARRIDDHRRTSLKLLILSKLRECGDAGATDEELEALTGIGGSTLRPRRGELAREQLIEHTGTTRMTTSGLHATVWRAR